MKHKCLTQEDKEWYIEYTKENSPLDIIPENFEYFMKNGYPSPDVCYVLNPARNCKIYFFLIDKHVTKEVKKALKENRLLTDEDWLKRYYDEKKQEYAFDPVFYAKTQEEFIEKAKEAIDRIHFA